MAAGFSAVNLANKWLNVLRGTTFTGLTGFYAKLHTGDPGSAGTANAAVGDATRKTVTFSAAAAGSIAMSSMSGNWTNAGTSESISHISFWDDASAGNFIDSVQVTTPKSWVSGDQIALLTLTIALAPIAA